MPKNYHSEKLLEQIAHEAANFISREAGTESLITVIRAEAQRKGERINVFVSVYPLERAQSALAFLARHREDFSEHLKEHTRLMPLPRIDFLLDNTPQQL